LRDVAGLPARCVGRVGAAVAGHTGVHENHERDDCA
jgi:hypothetical protein